jgi:hypothetical protein
MKQYYAVIKIKWSNFGIEGKSKKDAKRILKAIFKEQYGIELSDKEIKTLVVEKE